MKVKLRIQGENEKEVQRLSAVTSEEMPGVDPCEPARGFQTQNTRGNKNGRPTVTFEFW